MRNAWIGSWLFVFGSVIFTFDASIDAAEVCSFRSFLRLLACLLFVIGCFLLIPEAPQEEAKSE